ncbi:MAG TPA: chemotaxis protein CheA [Patescibacteria group bacterium]|nr:chemotaxis protein CheA [Patescibacteria group bacterium]
MTANDPVATFRLEAQELLDQLEQALLDLEQSPDRRDLIDGAFRALHTLKGSGAMFGFEAMAGFTHHVENAFDQVRKGQLAICPALVGVALAAQDHIRGMIDTPDGEHAARGDALLAELAALLTPCGACRVDDQPPAQRWRISFRLAQDAMAMGNNPLLLLDELRGLGHCTVVALTDGVPDLAEIQPDGCYLGWDVVLTTTVPRAEIEGVFLFVADDAQLSIEPIGLSDDARLGEILTARGEVTQQLVEEMIAQRPVIGEMLVEAGKVSPEAVKSALAEQGHIARDNLQTAKLAKSADTSIRVPAERLDELMDRVGELVIAQARFKQLAAAGGDPQMKAMAEEMDRLSSELRDTTMGIRMVPISSLFGRFRRLVHDLSRDLGKSVRLVTSGEDTELDKTVIERLNDPLVHLVRNAIDHGLETAAERTAAGKPGEGTVRLEAFQSGAQVVIRVSEDGRGLDRARIQAKAEENGIIAPGAKLSDDELFQLVFQPGFSTAKEVTSVSGRGVGMDVVKRGIEALRGTVDIGNGSHGGACVTVRLPLTLAIIDGLLVRVGKGRFVIPLADVEECVELTAEADAHSRGRSFLNIRGDLVPFLRLREMFSTVPPPDRYQKVVVVSVSGRRVGLVVDQVIGEHQTVIKSLSCLHADIDAFSGATILGDGAVALILDVEHLVACGQGREEDRRLAG